MTKTNLTMIENSANVPFTAGYRLVSDMSVPEWFVKFRRSGFESYVKNFSKIDSDIAKLMSEGEFHLPDIEVFPSLDMLLKYAMLDVEAYTVVLINGQYSDVLSSEEELPFSVFSDGLKSCVQDDAEFLDGKLHCDENPFVALNSAYLSNGVVIEIGDGERLLKPIHIISVVVTEGEQLFLNPRVIVNVGANVSVDIIESCLSFDEKYFENRVVQCNVGANSSVNYYKYCNLSEESLCVENSFVDVAHNAKFNQVVFAKDVGVMKLMCQFDVGTQASVDCAMSVMAKNSENVFVDVLINHSKSLAKSNVNLFGVACDKAKVHFSTDANCVKDVDGVETKQISRILLASQDALGRIKPFQNIAAENVRAYHGAVVSGVNPADIFYLQSRGIDEEGAKRLVLRSCLAEVLQNIHNLKIYDAFSNIMEL